MTDTPLCVADVLERAADLIEPKGAWTQGELARDIRREPTDPDEPDAACWCLEGALQKVCGRHEAYQAVRRVVAEPSLWGWNDDPNRTQEEVVAALRRAATLARVVQS